MCRNTLWRVKSFLVERSETKRAALWGAALLVIVNVMCLLFDECLGGDGAAALYL